MTKESPSTLIVKNLELRTPDNRVLIQKLSLELKAGQLLFIHGPNGSGKSTLLRVLLGEARPTRGSVKLSASPRKIAYLPQVQNKECHLPLTLRDVLEVAAQSQGELTYGMGLKLLPQSRLGLAWNRASGGERQRTLLTRELMRKPEILALDEPLNHLDPDSREKIGDVLSQVLGSEERPTALIVSHEDFLAGKKVRGRINLYLDGEGNAQVSQ